MTDHQQEGGTADQQSIPCPFRDGGARNWDAWLDAQPGPDGKKLIVIGEVNAGAGYTGRLTFTHTDKMLPPNQYAELKLVEEQGAPAGWREIRAEQETSEGEYGSVVIYCHDELLVTISPVPVVE